MSNDLNRCEFIGRLGRDVEMRYMPNGDAVANLSLACGSSWNDKQTGEKKESTEWIRVTAFKKLAEIMGKYLVKGSQVYISGRMRTRQYEKEGQTHYSTEIIADQLQMLGSRSHSGNERSHSGGGNPAQESGDEFKDDIPFITNAGIR